MLDWWHSHESGLSGARNCSETGKISRPNTYALCWLRGFLNKKFTPQKYTLKKNSDKNSVPDTQKLREKLSFKVTVGVSRNEKASKSLCNKERSEFDKAILLLNFLLCKLSMTFWYLIYSLINQKRIFIYVFCCIINNK